MVTLVMTIFLIGCENGRKTEIVTEKPRETVVLQEQQELILAPTLESESESQSCQIWWDCFACNF